MASVLIYIQSYNYSAELFDLYNEILELPFSTDKDYIARTLKVCLDYIEEDDIRGYFATIKRDLGLKETAIEIVHANTLQN